MARQQESALPAPCRSPEPGGEGRGADSTQTRLQGCSCAGAGTAEQWDALEGGCCRSGMQLCIAPRSHKSCYPNFFPFHFLGVGGRDGGELPSPFFFPSFFFFLSPQSLQHGRWAESSRAESGSTARFRHLALSSPPENHPRSASTQFHPETARNRGDLPWIEQEWDAGLPTQPQNDSDLHAVLFMST